MSNPAVHWHEGLFLRPHHFQAADRHWSENLRLSEQWDHAYGYGIHDFEYSREALSNHQFEVHRLRARMQDGTLIDLNTENDLERINLKEAFESESTVRVFIGIPKLRPGRKNVSQPAETESPRFLEKSVEISDESAGGNEQQIQLKNINVKLVLSNEDSTAYELLPIAQIKRTGAAEATPQLDTNYIPPVLTINSWPELGRDIVRAIYDVIGQKIEVLSQQILNRGIGLESRDPGDVDRILMLSELNSAYGVLGILAFSRGVHPLTIYTELCRIVGQLSIFGPDRRIGELPAYDHDDLASIFKEVQRQIERLLNTVRAYEYEQRFFIGVGMGMNVTLEPKWFNADWEWYIGVNKGDLTQTECRELLSPGQLDWKFGSARQVEMLFMQRAQGVNLRSLDRPIRALPSRPEWIYYELAQRDGAAWHAVQATQSLALRLKDSLIVNQDRLQGEKQLVVSANGRQASLQFALFAVPTQR